ncbi:hypothetical protein JUJ52_10750 [Virgibacillus sp. AGTR]|uniref:hypothetical protein n=1 Tax=Virgibacillus TaxID=84406 RepID=UPI000EF53B93|nr:MULTISPECIES: hypothetical protein [Virgibacillus]MCC2250441.1 hypothetical protein [Virgibacillus sp. AGTR]QRZ19855.1 hypothetical protein JUJ52_09580 [Virgibacillus sp. AGTR]WBX80464.1 hypothetical protein PD280_00810 [Virgibacillus salarius]
MKSLSRFWLPWVLGVIVAVVAISLWNKKEIDWDHIMTMSIAGLIGMLIATGIKMAIKMANSKSSE